MLKQQDHDDTTVDNSKPLITIRLPWIPGVSPKLRKVYKKAGYKTVFKSTTNLQNILCAKKQDKFTTQQSSWSI